MYIAVILLKIIIVCDCILSWLMYLFIYYLATSYTGSNIGAEFYLVIYSKVVWQIFEDHQIVLQDEFCILLPCLYHQFNCQYHFCANEEHLRFSFNAVTCKSGMC